MKNAIKFLKHIKRTKVLFRLIAADSEDVEKDYKTIRDELSQYEKSLAEKPEYVFISRTDMVSPEELKDKKEKLKKINPNVFEISIYDPEAMEKIEELIDSIKKQ